MDMLFEAGEIEGLSSIPPPMTTHRTVKYANNKAGRGPVDDRPALVLRLLPAQLDLTARLFRHDLSPVILSS